MKKGVIFIVFLILIFSSIYADFRDDERPVWGMLNDTAYILQAGEWNIDLWGPISLGLFNIFQINTNFWLWFPQVPNVNLKCNIIKESDVLPAFSIGGSYMQFTHTIKRNDEDIQNTLKWYHFGGYISKQFTPTMYLSGAYIYNGIYTPNELTLDDILLLAVIGTKSSSKILLDFIIQTGKIARFYLNGVLNLGDKVEPDAGFGIEWALGDIFRLKIGIYVPMREKLYYFPFFDLHWRFK